MTFNKLISLVLGMISGLAFAPTFILPGLLGLAVLCYQIQNTYNYKQAAILGLIFGWGHFLTGMYWISLGVSVYIDEFWWAIPFALFGLPLILACFISASCAFSWFARSSNYYHIIFCTAWVFFEWLRSWIFTGLPWNLLGYSLAFSDILIQPAGIVGIYGLSFIVIYVSTSFANLSSKQFIPSLLTSLIIIITVISYGIVRLQDNPTNFSDIKVRLVQPSIPQVAKWDAAEFWKNLDSHINLSLQGITAESESPDLIIWSEAALVAPYNYQPVKNKLLEMLGQTKSILITGGITDNNKNNEDYEIYTTLQAIAPTGDVLFEYHKSHLVPFGEYMPLKNILPIKKITHGFIDYTEGNGELVSLSKLNLAIKPLICYEVIFPSLVRTSNKITDVLINVTNDAWYGKSSGPYQHLYISRLRAVENGLPLLRVGNNGISAIIDPLGRIVNKLSLNEVGVIDGNIPKKLMVQTVYSKFGDINMLLISIFLVLLIQPVIKFAGVFYRRTCGKT